MRPPITDLEIKNWIFRQHGFYAEDAWISRCKEVCGIPVPAPKAQAPVSPCPAPIRFAIKQALRHFGLLSEE
jgi:hypothetical protein